MTTTLTRRSLALATLAAAGCAAYADTLASCVPRELFKVFDVPADPQPPFEVPAARPARVAREMEEDFYLNT